MLVRARVGGAFAVLVLALAVASALAPRPPPPSRPDFGLSGWRTDPGRLAPVWTSDDALASQYPLDAEGRSVLEAMATLGLAEAAAEGRHGQPTDATAAVHATSASVGAATDYWFSRGRDGFMALGVHARKAAEDALVAAMDAARSANMRITPWVAAHPDDPRVVALRRTSGTFVEHAAGWGLLTDDGFAGGNPDLVRIHLKCRWVLFVTEVMDYTFLLHEEELRALWRWRVEGDRNLAMEKRLEATRRLKQDLEPAYPAFRVLGSLYALRGENRKAIENFREALLDDPFDEIAARNLDYLLRY